MAKSYFKLELMTEITFYQNKKYVYVYVAPRNF